MVNKTFSYSFMVILVILFTSVLSRPTSPARILEKQLHYLKELVSSNVLIIENLPSHSLRQVCISSNKAEKPIATSTSLEILDVELSKVKSLLEFTNDKTVFSPWLYKSLVKTKHHGIESLILLEGRYGRMDTQNVKFTLQESTESCDQQDNLVRFVLSVHLKISRVVENLLTDSRL